MLKRPTLIGQSEQFNSSAQGELDLLNMKSQQHQSKINLLDGNLSSLEVVAPHDGLLTHSVDWYGEKPRAGQTLWPGQKIAGLPDTSVMQIKLYVKEREAINLKQDHVIEFSLISTPNKTFSGKISKLSPFPKSIKRQDPQKYYEITASIDEQGDYLRPGLKVVANIVADQPAEKLLVPKFSVFADEEGAYVQLKTASGFSKAQVTLGASNLSHVEIVKGLSEGDEIALVEQDGKL
ncbi:efflux RND transporter periplasmic adaptor subunit [Pseudoalteromonas piratica]|uniref:efflux RND transporter periplasmic adaptor subunit n=1 Tax=Pseudoalteromonas piratica TaxID=1348114 RepID=UPI000A6959B8|nr:HlyD family efflux transporter periplasmic adaptor subunit [Pseudoalteromonas piratica]